MFSLINSQNDFEFVGPIEEILTQGFTFPEGDDPFAMDCLDSSGLWDTDKQRLVLTTHQEHCIYRFNAIPEAWLIQAMGL